MPPASLPNASDPLSNIITVTGAGVNAEISGLTVKGPGSTGCGSLARGILVTDGATANIHDNKVLDIRDNVFSGCQNGRAIQVGLGSAIGTATISNNIVSGYQKGGIYVYNTGSSATITGNTVTGAGTTNVIAQNGICILLGATATISGNTVSRNSFNLTGNVSDWGACGILLYQSGAVSLTGGNNLSENDNNYYATGVTGALSLGTETFGILSAAPVTKGYQILVDENINIDASLCTFESISPATATLAQLFAIEDRIWHSVDDPTKTGFVKVKAGNVYVTRTETGIHIQNGIDAAAAGDVVHVQAGDYGTETAVNRTVPGAGTHQFGLFIDKNNLTVQGYTASNNIPVTAAEAAVLFSTNATNNFGYSGTMVVGNNVTLRGLEFGDNLPGNDKAIEVIGNGFAINACRIIADAAIYIGDYSYNENGTPGNFTDDLSSIQSYSITNCHFAGATSTGGVYIANGAGWNGSDVTSFTGRTITGNVFDGMTTIGFAGLTPGAGWLLYPTGAATVTGNTFTNPANGRYIQSWGVVQAEFPYASYWNDNTFPKKTITTTDGNPNNVRGYDVNGTYSYLNLKRIGTVIQPRIDNAQISDVVLVGAGNYNEDITINKTVTLQGASYSNTIVSGPIGGAGATMQVAAGNVVIDGFSITRDGNNPTDWNSALNSAGIAVQSQGYFAEIRNCSLYGNRTGIDINNSNGNNIHNNLIDNNRTGLIFRNQTDNTNVAENFITNNWTIGLLFLDGSGGTNSPVQTAINSNFSNNNISGNWYGDIQDRQSGGSIPAPGVIMKDFDCNWYGTTAPVVTTVNSTEPGYAAQIPVIYGGTAVPPVGAQPDVMGTASANLDYVSYLLNGTDNNGTSIGFQPAPGACGGTPVEIISAVPDPITCGETEGSILVTWSGGAANYDIEWPGGSQNGITGNTYTITGLNVGSVNIKVTEANGTSDAIVADILYLPVTNTTDGLSFATIQEAIDATTTGDGEVITVCAGIYNEDIFVSKSLDIRGPNYNISPNPAGSRIAEAIIHPATSFSANGEIIDISASNVKINGFTLDGDNPSLSSGITGTNGADINALEGIAVYTNNINNLNVSNNIIKNLEYTGVTILGYDYSAPATTGHQVVNNLLLDLGTYNDPGGYNKYGIGVLIYDGQYTRIADNVITNVRVGIQTGNFHGVSRRTDRRT